MNTKQETLSTGPAINPSKVSQKSRLAALLFCIFLGSWGAHRFYTGKIASAILMLLSSITLAVMGLGLLAFVWWFIDLCRISAGKFKDKNGLLIRSWKKQSMQTQFNNGVSASTS